MSTKQVTTPVSWTQHNTLSQLLVKLVEPQQPTVLVLSLPAQRIELGGRGAGLRD